MSDAVRNAIWLYNKGYTIVQISKQLNESPFLVAQWVKSKKART